MTVLMSAYLIRSRVVPRKNGFRLYNYYMVVGMRAFLYETNYYMIANREGGTEYYETLRKL